MRSFSIVVAFLLVGVTAAFLVGASTGSAQTVNCDGTSFRLPNDPQLAYSIRNNISATPPTTHDDNIGDESPIDGRHNITSNSFEDDGAPFYKGADCRRTNENESPQLNTSLTHNGNESFAGFTVVKISSLSGGQFEHVIQKRDGTGNVHIQVSSDCDGNNNDGVRVTLADDSGNFPNVEECTSQGSKFTNAEYVFYWRYNGGNDTFEAYRSQSDSTGDTSSSLLNASLVKIGTIDEPNVGHDLSAADNDNQHFRDSNIEGKLYHYRWYRHHNVTLDELQSVAVEPFIGLEADFSFSCTDLTCDFTDESTVGTGFIEHRNWTFGDGDSNTGNNATNPSHTYDSFGSFDVTLTITDNNGDTDSTTQTVDLALGPEFNTTAGLFSDSNIRAIGTSWNRKSPTVFARDTRTTSNLEDGRVVKWNETLTHEITKGLCQDQDLGIDLEETNTNRGFAVSKDSSPFLMSECVDATNQDRELVLYNNQGDFVLPFFGIGSRTGTDVDVQSRSLNNITVVNSDFRGLIDAGAPEYRWNLDDADRSYTRTAIEWNSSRDTVSCYTGSTDGTECRNATGFVIGKDTTLNGDDIALFDNVLQLKTGNDLRRLGTSLTSINSTTSITGLVAPIEISKTGRFVAHVNNSDTRDAVTVRHAVNGTHVVTTQDDLDNMRALSFHPRDERIYAANATRIVAYNLTDFVSTSDDATTDDTTTDTDEEDDPTQPSSQDPAGIDLDQMATSLGVTRGGAEIFASILLILGITGGSIILVSRESRGSGGPVVAGGVGAIGSSILTWQLGWFPIWALFAMFLVAGALVAATFNLGGE